MWVLFAILFYQSGLTFTVWLMQPEAFIGGMQWLWFILFPLLLPAFFIVNRHLGCATGACESGQCDVTNKKHGEDNFFGGGRMPG